MRRFIFAAALAMVPVAGLAQDSSGEGSNPIEEGVEQFLRGLLDEMRPPLQELAGIGATHLLTLQALTEEMGPAFLEVFEQIDSVTYYRPPEILPNGDIVFRRSPDAPPWEPPEAEAAPERERTEPRSRPDPSEPEADDFRPSPGLGLEL